MRDQVLLTVLPKPRMSRHPYQLCMMLALVTIGMSQLIIGPPPTSAIKGLPQSSQDMLNWFCVYGGLAGVSAAIIPERIIRWKLRTEHAFDATWARLWIELGCHGLLFTVWASYMVAISMLVPFKVGLGLGSGLVFWLAISAVWRAVQISLTIKRAIFDPPQKSGIISSSELP